MNVDAVVLQLKQQALLFAGNVAGAADYAQAAGQVWLPQPAAYVIPLEDEPEPNAKQTGLLQVVREKVGVIVDLDNSLDRRGQAASTLAVAAVRSAVFSALLNWRPDPTRQARGFSYAGGSLLGNGVDRAWLRWQFDFVVETTITDLDGFQIPSTPLTSIEANPPDLPGAPPVPLFTIPIPQG